MRTGHRANSVVPQNQIPIKTSMTALSDLLQIILSQPDPERGAFVAAALSLLLLALRIFGKGLEIVGLVVGWLWAKSPLNFRAKGWFWRMARLAVFTIVLCSFAPEIHDQFQRWEQTHTHPAYVIQHAEPEVAYAYEKQAEQHLTQSELAFFKRRVDEIAAKIGSTPLALMEVGFSECGLNPFALNIMDGRVVAAGFIQFTSAGLTPCLLDGKRVSMEQVKEWCRARNLERVMALTEVYFDSFAKGRPLPRAIDIYLCVFAPAFIGAGPD